MLGWLQPLFLTADGRTDEKDNREKRSSGQLQKKVYRQTRKREREREREKE